MYEFKALAKLVNEIQMIFQDPMSSLNPFLKISTQMIETIQLHQGLDKKAAREKWGEFPPLWNCCFNDFIAKLIQPFIAFLVSLICSLILPLNH